MIPVDKYLARARLRPAPYRQPGHKGVIRVAEGGTKTDREYAQEQMKLNRAACAQRRLK